MTPFSLGTLDVDNDNEVEKNEDEITDEENDHSFSSNGVRYTNRKHGINSLIITTE